MSALDSRAERAASDRPSAGEIRPLRRLQRDFLEATRSTTGRTARLQQLVQCLRTYVGPLTLYWWERDDTEESLGRCLWSDDRGATDPALLKLLAAITDSAWRSGEVEVRSLASPARLAIVAPAPREGTKSAALVVVYPLSDSTPHLVMLTQLVLSHVELGDLWDQQASASRGAQDAAAVLELIERVLAAPDLHHGCVALAQGLARHLECPRILVGWRHRPNSSCQLMAISAVAHFDRRAAAVQTMEAALDEVVLHQTIVAWPPSVGADTPTSKTLGALAQQESAPWILGIPLTVSESDAAFPQVGHREERAGESARPLGALLVLGETLATAHDATRALLTTASAPLAAALESLWRREPGWFTKGWRIVLGNHGEKRRFLVGGGVLLALLCLSAPWPYSLSNDCRLEPVQRRFVASPFEGVLDEACVKPGDVVQEGELLARLDGREIRWKRAAVEADRQQARKKRDAAQAAHNYAEQQIAQLEIERLEVELRLLDHRAAHLEVRSPIAGVIASGDLERAAGAPLQLGQTLFEVAPLDQMLVEIAVPDDDVSHLRAGQSLEVRLDAFPGQKRSTTLVRVHPRAEVRDGVNVFVAEGPVDNSDGQLRPGMKGRARLSLGWRPAGWVLFHKPWEYLTKLLAW